MREANTAKVNLGAPPPHGAEEEAGTQGQPPVVELVVLWGGQQGSAFWSREKRLLRALETDLHPLLPCSRSSLRLGGSNWKVEKGPPESTAGIRLCPPPWGPRACYASRVGRLVPLEVNSICCWVYVRTATRAGREVSKFSAQPRSGHSQHKDLP